MAEGKVGRPRTDSMKLHLAVPKDIGNWIEKQVERQPFCRSRQDFIVGVLEQVMKSRGSKEQLELQLEEVV